MSILLKISLNLKLVKVSVMEGNIANSIIGNSHSVSNAYIDPYFVFSFYQIIRKLVPVNLNSNCFIRCRRNVKRALIAN